MTDEILQQLNSIDLTPKISEIQKTQDDYFNLVGKYLMIEKIDLDNYFYSVDELQYPNNTFGYSINFIKIIDGIVYKKVYTFGSYPSIINWSEYLIV